MRHVIVTGARGYLGGHVVSQLLKAGHRVYETNALMDGIATFLNDDTDAVVHLGWYAAAGDEHADLQELCFAKTVELAKLLVAHPKAKLIFSSTASVYGDREPDDPVSEMDACSPTCAYTRTKLEAEEAVRNLLFSRRRSLTFRFGSFMGLGVTRTRTDLVVNSIAVDAWTRKHIELWSPESIKPVIHVADAAKLIVHGVETEAFYGLYNAAPWSWRAMDIALTALNIIPEATLAEISPLRSGRRSCLLVCDGMHYVAQQMGLEFQTIENTIRRFEGFQETPNCKMMPWRNPSVSPAW